MFNSMRGRIHSAAKRVIVMILCVGMLLSASASFLTWAVAETNIAPIAVDKKRSKLEKAPENVAPEQDPVSMDGTTIERITVRWLSTSTGEDSAAGFGRLTLEPESDKVTNQQFQIDFSLSGQSDYAPGDIEITFPAYLWLDRYGNEPGELTLSIPEEGELGADFVWKRVGDYIVITNAKTLPAASKVLIQGTFRNVSASEMFDETQAFEFNVDLTVNTSEGNELTATSNSIDAYIDTSVRVTGASKSAYDANAKKYNIFWDEVPSGLPTSFLDGLEGDPADYVYIRWYVTGTASGSQPFEMTVTDTIEMDGDSPKYGGIMLGATNTENGGSVRSTDGRTVTATLFRGYSENNKSAYIWTAYPKANFPEGEEVTFHNDQTITVTGLDDNIPSTMDAGADVISWSPKHYKFIKIWDDNDNIDGKRPGALVLEIYDGKDSSEPDEEIILTQENAQDGDESRWVYEWTDNGQPGHDYRVDERLSNNEGVLEDRFDDEDRRHQLRWSYYLSSATYDERTNTWEYVNTYDVVWTGQSASKIDKNVEKKYTNNQKNATTDSVLNDLIRGRSAEIQFTVQSTLSAVRASMKYNADANVFVLEDGSYSFNDNYDLSVSDMNIAAVILEKPAAYKLGDKVENTNYYPRVPLNGQTATLYGYIENDWKPLAEITTDGDITVLPGAGVTVEGRRVNMPDNTESVKLQIESEEATVVEMEYTVALRIYPTQDVRDMVQRYIDNEDFVMFPVFNRANGYVEYNGEDSITIDGRTYGKGDKLTEITDYDIGYVHGRQRKVAAEMTKTFEVTDNDENNQSVVIHTELTLTQQSNITVMSEYLSAIENGELPNTRSGIFYDLLPKDVSPDLTTISATGGDTVSGYYAIPDYKGSGRTMLVVMVNFVDNITYTTKSDRTGTYPSKGYKNSHTVTFDSLVTWEVADDRARLDAMFNVAAYEANEDWIGSVDGWRGEPDDPRANNNITSGNAVRNDADYMTGLHDSRASKDPSFVYAGTVLSYEEIDVYATTSIWKEVQANGTGLWGSGQRNNVNVEEGGSYVYQITMKSAEKTNTRDIIIIDSLENYIPKEADKADYGDTQWHGTLEYIDLSNLKDWGINPVIYYSTVKNLDVSSAAMDGSATTWEISKIREHLEGDMYNGELVWSIVEPEDLSTVTAIAIDASKTTDGTDFVLNPEESLIIRLHMKAPFDLETSSPEYFKNTDGTDYLKNAHAYNEIYLECLQEVEGRNTRSYINQNYTKVGIYTKYINVTKVWDDSNNADGYRPESITVRLLANGEDTGKSIELNEENNWSGKFERLHTYDEDRDLILYSFSEDAFDDDDKYQFTFSETEFKDGHIEAVLTNRHTPEQIDIPVSKLWEGDKAATRPAYVVIRLYADGVFTGKTLTLTPDNAGNWSGIFTGLDKKRDGGIEIVYTIEEEYVDDYLSTVEDYTVTNVYHPMGDLIVHKNVENVTPLAKDAVFEYELVLTNEDGTSVQGRYQYVIYNKIDTENDDENDGETDEIADVIDSLGEIGDGDTFVLKGGQYIVIRDIPTHVKYTVEEKNSSGFTLSSVSGDTGVIRPGDNEAYFINTYNSKGSFSLDLTKTLEGQALKRNVFRFDLTDEAGNVIYSAYNDSNGQVYFAPIKYTEADNGNEYTYYVYEYNSDMPGYTYDDARYKIVVSVSDNGRGSVDCETKYYDLTHYEEATEIESISFNNTYEASGSLQFRLWKTIDRDFEAGEFTFALYDQNFNLISKAENDAAGVALFDEIEFDQNDIDEPYFLYFARELKGDDETVRYSDTILGYMVIVTDNGDGTLSFTSKSYDLSEYFEKCTVCDGFGGEYTACIIGEECTLCDGAEEECANCTVGAECTVCKGIWEDCTACSGFGYINSDTFDLEEAASPVIHNGLSDGSLSVTKHVESSVNGKLPDEEFRFKIVLIGDEVNDGEFTYEIMQIENVEFSEPEDEESGVAAFFRDIWVWIQSIFTADDGLEGVPVMEVDESEKLTGKWENGEFSFVLHGGQKAVFDGIPAGTAYQVWEDTPNGWMQIAQSNISGVIQPIVESEAEFTNRYQPDMAAAVLTGVKYLDGKATNVDNDGGEFAFALFDEDDKNLGYAYAQPGGFFTFDALTFTEKGEYKYTIREVDGGNGNINYDNHVEKVTVNVDYDTNGNLVATVIYDDDGIVFENKTIPGSLEIKKQTENLTDENKDATFTFRVKFYNPTGVPLSDGAFTWYVKNTETGEIVDMHQADIETIAADMRRSNAIALDDQEPTPVPDEPTGIVGTVRWTLSEDGILSFVPMDGEEGELRIYHENAYGQAADVPWHEYASQVKAIKSIGTIHIVGDVSYLFSDMTSLTDASALADWDMLGATVLDNLFNYNNQGVEVITTPLSDFSFLENWDVSNVTSMKYMFCGTSIKNTDVFKGWDVSHVTEIAAMFSRCAELTDLNGIKDWEVGNVINISSLFSYCYSLTDLTPIAGWDISNVINMYATFANCTALSDVTPLEDWDTSTVKYMDSLFNGCKALKNVNGLYKWDTTSLIYLSSMFGYSGIEDLSGLANWKIPSLPTLDYMFQGCKELTNVDGLLEWDVSHVTSMKWMFDGCTSLTSLEGMRKWDVSHVTTMEDMFPHCDSLADLSGLEEWDVSSLTNMSYMFNYCPSLANVDAMLKWDVSNVTEMNATFNGCSALTDISGLQDWKITSLTTMSSMFAYTALTNVDPLLKWDVSGVASMNGVFSGCKSLSDVKGLARWRVVNVTDMRRMFSECTALSDIDSLTDWTFGDNIVDMSYMFIKSGLVNVNGISGWKGAKAGNVTYMFQDCEQLVDITGLVGLDVSECTSLAYTFQNCSSLASLDGVEKWNVSKCASLEYTFDSCSSLTSIAALADWDVSGCTTFQRAFQKCSALQSIVGLEKWKFSRTTSMYYMFANSGVSDLTPLKDWDLSKVNNLGYIFYYCANLKTLNGLENWKIAIGAYNMFAHSGVVDASAIRNWSLENVESSTNGFNRMFYKAYDLTTLDFSNWDGSKISSVTDMLTDTNSVSKITFGKDFWNGTVTSTLKIFPEPPPTNITTGRWVKLEEAEWPDPEAYSSQDLVTKKVTGTYIWQYLPPYTIKFDSNDGSGDMLDYNGYYHMDNILPDNLFTKPDHIFVGWLDVEKNKAYDFDDDGNIVIPHNTYKSGQTITLKAIWAPLGQDGYVEYTVEYYQQSLEDPEVYVKVDTVVKRALPGYEDYLEAVNYPGFITPDDAEGWYDIPVNGYLTIKLYYDRVHYTIHFDGNGAEYGSMSDIDMVGDVAVELPESGFGVTSGAFLGWNTEKDGDGIWYYPGQPVKNLASDGVTFILYAQWQIIDQPPVGPTAGEIIVTCGPGQTIVIQNLPAGITYEIEEINLPAGWSYKEGMEEKGTIFSNSTAYASVTNEYSATGSAIIVAHKALDGGALVPGRFWFDLTEKEVTQVYKTVGYDSKGNVVETYGIPTGKQFGYLPDGADVNAKIQYVAYYNAPVELHIYGKDSEDHSWEGSYDEENEVEITEGEDELEWHYTQAQADKPAFELVNQYDYNEYQQKYLASMYYMHLTYSPTVNATVGTVYNGTVDTIEQSEDVDGNKVNNPYYGTASVIFDPIEYTHPGEYVYNITEINGGDSTVDYDGDIKTVRVIVEDNGNGTLSTRVIYETEDGNEPVFMNSMKPGNLTVSKQLSNGTAGANDVEFEFMLILKDADKNDLTGEYDVEKSNGETLKVENGGIVKIKGGEWFTVYNLPHGCQYEVVELSRDGFTIAESEGSQGEIVGGETSYAKFSNVYSARGELVLRATKEFLGGTISANQFAFVLADQENEIIETVYADEEGNVVFSPLYFTEADVGYQFVYHIYETAMDDDSIGYDTHTADIAVTVVDKANGTIEFEVDCDRDDLIFTNIDLTALIELPATYGGGVTLIYIAGIALILASALMYLRMQRKSN